MKEEFKRQELLYGAEAMERWVFYRGLCGISTTPDKEIYKIENTTASDVQNIAKRITLDTVYFLTGEEAK